MTLDFCYKIGLTLYKRDYFVTLYTISKRPVFSSQFPIKYVHTKIIFHYLPESLRKRCEEALVKVQSMWMTANTMDILELFLYL